MANRLILPYILPLHFVPINPVQIPQYVSRHMDSYLHANRLNKYQSGTYFQPWLNSDTIPLQVQNGLGFIQFKIIDCKNKSWLNLNFQQKQRNPFEPTTFIYEVTAALASLPPDKYWVVLKTGDVHMISEPIKIAATIENTLLLEYSHFKYKDNLIFEKGYRPNLRVHGMIQLKSAESKDTLWEDQVLDMTLINSDAFEVWDFIIFSDSGGVPDWMLKKLSRIFGCSDVRIDGRYYTKNDGAKWEQMINVGNGSLKGYRYELRERINRNSSIISGNEDTNFDLNVMYLTDTKGFGDISGQDSSNLIQVLDFE